MLTVYLDGLSVLVCLRHVSLYPMLTVYLDGLSVLVCLRPMSCVSNVDSLS